jgi:hypothetical protein
MTLGYGVGLSALIFAVLLVLLLILYLEKRRHLAVELRVWRERLDITQPQAAELLSNLWNRKFPDNQREFDERTIRRWEAGNGLFPLNYFKLTQIIGDKETFDATAAQARRDDLDVLDAFAGKRTPSSPPRMVTMPIESWKSFYSEELAATQMEQQTTKKRRRRPKR